MQTYERVREQGTIETLPGNAEDRIAAIRRIVAERQYAKVDGCMIDLFTASAIVQVFDKLNDTNKAKYANLPAPRMGQIAFQLMK